MRTPVALLVFAVLAVTAPGRAAETPKLLSPECETALALAAAPEHLRAGASLYLLGQEGYVKAREGTNGFTCIVNRDDPHSLKPTCFDAEGGRTIVPRILFVGRLLRAGVEAAEIERQVAAGFADGTFERPARPGVAYMLSPFNRPWDPRTQRLGWFPPHLMFYAPDLTNEDVGFSPDAFRSQPWLPFIGYQGAHGYMIVRLPGEVRPEDRMLPVCPDWVSAE